MTKNVYESYDYDDPDNEYTYPGSSVLRNKFDIKDRDLARSKEYQSVASRLIRLAMFPIEIHSMTDVLATHAYLFQDMYHWAGEFRKVNISKEGNAFMALQSFDTGSEYLNLLIQKYHTEANSRADIARSLAEILENLNYMHPFREGNGRTQREVVRSLAIEKGFYAEIDIDTDTEIYNLYMDGTVYGDVAKLTELFERILEESEE